MFTNNFLKVTINCVLSVSHHHHYHTIIIIINICTSIVCTVCAIVCLRVHTNLSFYFFLKYC